MLYYLASPYTDEDPRIMDARYRLVLTALALVLRSGKSAYSPIVHWHVVSLEFPDIPYEMYLINDLEHLSHCDVMLVLTSTGWDKSRGIAAEIAFAKDHHITIKYISPRTGEITDEPTTAN